MLVGADIAAEQQKIGRLLLEVLQHQPGCVIAKTIVPKMQVGGDGDAHANILAGEWWFGEWWSGEWWFGEWWSGEWWSYEQKPLTTHHCTTHQIKKIVKPTRVYGWA
jgi:hypothetical protein